MRSVIAFHNAHPYCCSWHVSCLFIWLVGWLVDWLVVYLAGWLIGWLVVFCLFVYLFKVCCCCFSYLLYSLANWFSLFVLQLRACLV